MLIRILPMASDYRRGRKNSTRRIRTQSFRCLTTSKRNNRGLLAAKKLHLENHPCEIHFKCRTSSPTELNKTTEMTSSDSARNS